MHAEARAAACEAVLRALEHRHVAIGAVQQIGGEQPAERAADYQHTRTLEHASRKIRYHRVHIIIHGGLRCGGSARIPL